MSRRTITASWYHPLASLSVALIWTMIIAGSLAWNLWQQRKTLLDEAHTQAQAALHTQSAIRHLITRVGGIYVPTEKGVEPNPFLAHLPHRDIPGPEGTTLTLVNSSYLVRLVDESIEGKRPIVRVRATSLQPIAEANRPDEWERASLRQLHAGAPNWSELTRLDGEWVWREMQPRIATPECLSCHRNPDIQPGDVLGALSVKVPLAPLAAAMAPQRQSTLLGHGVIWLLGLTGIFWIATQIRHWMQERAHMEGQMEKDLQRERSLGEILSLSLSDLPFEARLRRILESLSHGPVPGVLPRGSIYLIDPRTGRLQPAVSVPAAPPAAPAGEGVCSCGSAIDNRRMTVVDRVAPCHNRACPDPEPHGHYCVPIFSSERALGLFTLHVEAGRRPDRQEEGFLTAVADILGNLIERELARDHLERQAFYDALTGLPNRRLFLDRLQHRLETERRRGEGVSAVMFLDLDRFKTINDALGHDLGDRLLCEAAGRIADCVRPQDTVARLGGDEFTVLLEDIPNPATVTHVAERIHQAVEQPFDLDGRRVSTSTSIGIAFTDRPSPTLEELLRDADTAMYQAKSEGKGCTVIFDSAMHRMAQEALALEQGLKQALSREQLEAWYQPIVELEDGRIVGFEVLARWNHPQRGMIPPDRFIPLAEEAGMVREIDRRMLQAACRTLGRLEHETGRTDLFVAVNFSCVHFGEADFLECLERTLLGEGVRPEQVRLEVTEGLLLRNPDSGNAGLGKLKEMGFRIALDDFGTGYSSLSYLHRLPAHTLKIDRSFVTSFLGDEGQTALVETILQIARRFRLEVVAEGVESRSQAEALLAMGCSRAQGYLYSPPVPLEQALELLLGGRLPA